MAESLNITNYSGLRKQDLIFRIEQSLLDTDTVLRGEGVLEILPEGYGFLRSPTGINLYAPTTSMSRQANQAFRSAHRRHDHGPGAAPKEGERYLALLESRSRQRRRAEKAKHRVAFDNLRPRLSRVASSSSSAKTRSVDAGDGYPVAHRQRPARIDRVAAKAVRPS